jgi:DNA repair protein RadC
VNSLKNLAPDDLPREKLLSFGPKALSNAELLAILIGSGNREMNAVDLCRLILSQNGNDLEQIAKLSIQELMQFKGIGEAKAISIISALEIGRRRKSTQIAENQSIDSSYTTYNLLHKIFMDLKHEEFWIICLNNSSKLIKLCEISRGGFNNTLVDSKIVFKTALENRASRIILTHNHPSGSTQPSENDKILTKKLFEAGKNLDIHVVDHLIYTNNAYYSFADEGLMI